MGVCCWCLLWVSVVMPGLESLVVPLMGVCGCAVVGVCGGACCRYLWWCLLQVSVITLADLWRTVIGSLTTRVLESNGPEIA